MGESATVPPVEVVYATADEQRLVTLAHEPGLTAGRAVELSGLARRFPEILSRPLVLGIFGVQVEPGRQLAPGDRVEICRPLGDDARAMRRKLLATGKVMGSASSKAAK